jgi:hypothetical protein
MKVSDVYQSNWLKAEDLQGAPRRVTIEGVSAQKFKNSQDNTEETKIVLSFVGKQKKMSLNKTNAGALVRLFGDDTDQWHGREVMLVPTMASNQKPTISITGVPAAGSDQSF